MITLLQPARLLALSVAFVAGLAGCASAPPASASPGTADLILTGGRVVTLDDANPEGRAIALANGRVLAVGSEATIGAMGGDTTRVIELDGALVIPGLIEGHGHFLGIGDANMQLKLIDTTSWEEIVGLVAEAASTARPGELIRGRGWHQSKWSSVPPGGAEGLPPHDALSAAAPNNPVVLVHASGHMSFANAAAMELAEITRETANPDGGEIVRGPGGAAIGAFRETAQGLLAPVYANATPPDLRRVAELARDECLSKGITSFQDAGSSFEHVEVFREMADGGDLGLRLWVMLRQPNERLRRRLAPELLVPGDFLTVGGLKVSVDGALGSHGAWLLAPYTDLPTSVGLNTVTIESLRETAALAIQHDLQLCVHAIGDRANQEVLDVFEEFTAGRSDHRWRVEHAQHLNPRDIPRFASLGAIASMQGIHCTSDAAFVVDRLGEQRAEEGAYVWRTLMESGAVVTNGTDAPVEDVDPIASYYATVSRMTRDGTRFYPEQRLSRMDALRTYTINCAYSVFEEDLKGSLEPGKFGDITVLSKDILEIPEADVPNARVLYTIVGGEVLYEAQ